MLRLAESVGKQILLCSAVWLFMRRPDEKLTDGKYRLDNPRGYFAWWQEKYFGLKKQEIDNAHLRVPMQEMRPRYFVSGKGREQESSRL